MSNTIRTKCPTCDKQDTWHTDNPFKPFCSDRCKLIDLGEWASENHRIAGDPANNMVDDSGEDSGQSQ